MARKPAAKKSLKTQKVNRLHIQQRHALIGGGLLIGVWIILATLVFNRYQGAVKVALPKQNDTTQIKDLSWFDVQSDKAASAPIADYKYIGVSTTLQNISQQPIWYAPILHMYVKDTAGHQYGIEMLAFDTPLAAGQYEPQQELAGQLGYMVPVQVHDLEWCVSTKIDQIDPVCQPLVKDNKRQ